MVTLIRRPEERTKREIECSLAVAPVSFPDDVARIEPLYWNGCALAHTLTASWTLIERRVDVACLQLWAHHTVAHPTFLMQKFAAIRPLSKIRLTADAKRMLAMPNAGGNSALSEALAFDVLQTAFGVQLDRTEMEIMYWCVTKITDFSVRLGSVRIGVSVTRACRFKGNYTLEDADRLLRRKLNGILESTAHVITPHSWRRQMLFVWAQRASVADLVWRAWSLLPAHLRADTCVLVCVANNDQWLFFGDQTALV
jgi:hypothetical protein